MKIFAEFVGIDGVLARREVFVVRRNADQPHFKDFSLTLEEGKAMLQRVQAEQTQFQVERCGMLDRECTGCKRRRAIHDYRTRSIRTLFGICQVCAPRFRSCSCLASHDAARTSRSRALMAGRTTPELERMQAELGARLSFREVSRVLDLFVPAARPYNHKSVRNRLARVADHIETKDLSSPHRISRVGPGPMSVFIDGAYIRAVPGFQTRHFEIIMGRVETDGRVTRHFASVSEHTHEINAKMKRFLVFIDELATYLRLNQASVINYCQRYWKGLPTSSSRAESAVNAIINARMNKLQQVRWSPAGAQRVLQARAAVFDGRLKSGAFHLAV